MASEWSTRWKSGKTRSIYLRSAWSFNRFVSVCLALLPIAFTRETVDRVTEHALGTFAACVRASLDSSVRLRMTTMSTNTQKMPAAGRGNMPQVVKENLEVIKVPQVRVEPAKSLGELGLLVPEQVPRQPLQLSVQLLQSLLVKLGLLRLQSTGPRQNPNTQSLLMKSLLTKMGLLGPEQVARPAQPQQQQSRSLMMKFGLLGSQSAVPLSMPTCQCRTSWKKSMR